MTKNIDLKEIKNEIIEKSIIVIDVREVDEFKEGRVPGAINLPLSQLEFRYTELPKDKEYHVICRSGRRSLDACNFLENKGYTVTNVAGGTIAWTDELEK